MARNIGLDLGSSRTAIVLRGRGTVLCEPTVVLLNEEEEEMVAVGEKAAQMIGKTPEELSICYPVRYGSVVHCDEACAMLYEYLNRAAGTLPGKKSVLCGVAGRTTEIERLALEEIICDAGARKYDYRYRCRHDRNCCYQYGMCSCFRIFAYGGRRV